MVVIITNSRYYFYDLFNLVQSTALKKFDFI